MQVILLKNVKGSGNKGELRDVKDGYAVNYLIPKGFAAVATAEAVQKARTLAAKKHKEKVIAEGSVKKLTGKAGSKKVRIQAKVSSGGRLYASLSKEEGEGALEK